MATVTPKPAPVDQEVTFTPQALHSVTLILTPERDKVNCPYRFAVPIKTKNAKGNNDLIVGGIFLHPGSNVVSGEDFAAIKNNFFFKRCEKKGVIRVFSPEISEGVAPTGTTRDYDINDALEIIEQSNDIEWLQRCIAKDDRDGIAVSCQQRIKEIQESENRTDGGNNNA